MLLNPHKHNRPYRDDTSADIMRKTIGFFEKKGLKRLKEDDHERVWYADFLEFVAKNQLFATLMTPADYSDGAKDVR